MAKKSVDKVTLTLTELADRDQRMIEEGRRLAQEAEPVASSYEINVSTLRKDHRGNQYHHLFATHERSLTLRVDAERLLKILREKFPAPEYNVTLTAMFKYGKQL
jgi:hypothetical protein